MIKSTRKKRKAKLGATDTEVIINYSPHKTHNFKALLKLKGQTCNSRLKTLEKEISSG